MISIVTMRGDVHAEAVAWAINKLGKECTHIYPSELRYGDTWTISCNDSSTGFTIETSLASGTSFTTDAIDAIWFRRIPSVIALSELDDIHLRAACEAEIHSHVIGTLSSMSWGKFCVNSIGSIYSSERKSLQLLAAKKAGLNTPRTIVSNSADEINEFAKSLGGRVLYKPLQAIPWKTSDGSTRVARTTVLTDIHRLERRALQLSPAIYQEEIEKSHDVRVIIMGRTFFAWSTKPSKQINRNLVDWRFLNTSSLTYSTVSLPDEIKEKCITLMRSMNLVFACIDFVIDAHGNYFFLEANQAGQFLYGEQYGVAPGLLDTFTQFLLSEDENFDPRSIVDTGINFGEFKRTAGNGARKADFGEYVGRASFAPQ